MRPVYFLYHINTTEIIFVFHDSSGTSDTFA